MKEKPSNRTEKNREHILNAVEKALINNSVVQLTVAKVSRYAKLSRQAIYSYFPTKEDLISAFLIRSGEHMARKAEKVFLTIDDPHEATQQVFLQLLAFVQTGPIMKETSQRDQLAPFLSSRGELLIQLGRKVISSLLTKHFPITEKQARLPADNAMRLFLSHLLHPDPETQREDVAKQITDFLFTSLQTKNLS